MQLANKLSNILSGWANYAWSSEAVEAVAKKRADACAGCNKAIMKWYSAPLPDGNLKEVEGMVCAICDCPLSAMLRSKNETCRLKRW